MLDVKGFGFKEEAVGTKSFLSLLCLRHSIFKGFFKLSAEKNTFNKDCKSYIFARPSKIEYLQEFRIKGCNVQTNKNTLLLKSIAIVIFWQDP